MKKHHMFLSAFVLSSGLFFQACSDNNTNNLSEPTAPTPPANDQPNPGNDDNNNDPANRDEAWAQIHFDQASDMDDPECIATDAGSMTIREDRGFHLEECQGSKDGQLTLKQINHIKRHARNLMNSDLSKRTCDQSHQPYAETVVNITKDNGEVIPVYESLVDEGLCTRGSSRAAKNLYQAVREAFSAHDFPDREDEDNHGGRSH